MSADPPSWQLIEAGWKVVDCDGDEAGTVVDVLGDTGADELEGLVVNIVIYSAPRFVPGEHVTNVIDGFVQVDLDTPDLDRLDPYEE